MKDRMKKYIAEMLGTAIYVLIGCGTAMAVKTDYKNGCGYIAVALAFGITMAMLYYVFSAISGCHINPAVSLSALIVGKIRFVDFIFYIVSQLIGAFTACGVLLAIYWDHTSRFYSNVYYDENVYITLLIETVLTFIFVFAFTAISKKNGKGGAIYCGVSLCAVQLIGIQLTGASVNPARSFACAVFAGGESFERVPVFLIAPLLGATAAGFLSVYFFGKEKKDKAIQGVIDDNNIVL